MSRHCWLLFTFLLLGCVQGCWQLVIKSVNIPATVRVDETNSVILDCDYDLQNTSREGLVVKWFFNEKEVVYQWIYGRTPLAGDTIIKYIELMYKASDNPYTMYRAIKLNNPGIELTGEYKCVISTFADEEIANGTMIVYSTEEEFNLDKRERPSFGKDAMEVTCSAKGLYPEPSLDIVVESVPVKQSPKPMLMQRDDELYDISLRVTLLDEDLPETTTIKCLLGIPRVNYNVSREILYYSGCLTHRRTNIMLLIWVHLTYLIFYF